MRGQAGDVFMRGRQSIFLRETFFLSVCVVLCLFLSLSSALAADEPKNSYLGTDGKKDWTDLEYGKTEADICLKNMVDNGLYATISSTWGGSAEIGRALACMQTTGLAGNTGNPGTCFFYFDPRGDYAKVAESIGVEPSAFFTAINSDMATCAKAGYNTITLHMNGTYGVASDELGGLCNYLGGAQAVQYKKTGSCSQAREIVYISEYLAAAEAGKDPDIKLETQDDPSQECYGCVKVSGSQSGTSTILTCHDPKGDLSKVISNHRMAHQNHLRVVANEAAQEGLEAQAAAPLDKARGNYQYKFCIEKIEFLYDKLMWWLSSGEWYLLFLEILLEILNEYLNEICELVLSAIEGLTEMLCLPWPELPEIGSLPLPDISGPSCSGISLSQYLSVMGGARTLEGMGLYDEDSGILPTDLRPSPLPSLPYLIDNMIPSKKIVIDVWGNNDEE